MRNGGLDLEGVVNSFHFDHEIVNNYRIPKQDGFSYMVRKSCPHNYSCNQLIDEHYDVHISCSKITRFGGDGTSKRIFFLPFSEPSPTESSYPGYRFIPYEEFRRIYRFREAWHNPSSRRRSSRDSTTASSSGSVSPPSSG